MPISDIPILSMLRERMQWHQERQRVLAENVANADTPNYQRERSGAAGFRARAVAHFGVAGDDRTWPISRRAERRLAVRDRNAARYEVRPRGNAVTHEDEMMKVASNQMDFEAVADLYTRSLALIKLAIGKAA